MKSLEIKNVKKLMNDLFGGRAFDNFLVTQVKLSCMNNVEINGKINKSFLNEEEIEMLNGREYSLWSELKYLVFDVIKGKRLPKSMIIDLKLGDNLTEKVLEAAGGSFSKKDVAGLYMSLRFENNVLIAVSGTSMATFTMDKSVDRTWDSKMTIMLSGYLENIGNQGAASGEFASAANVNDYPSISSEADKYAEDISEEEFEREEAELEKMYV